MKSSKCIGGKEKKGEEVQTVPKRILQMEEEGKPAPRKKERNHYWNHAYN